MDSDFQVLEATLPQVLGTSPITQRRATEVEALVSEALANIANEAPREGLQRLRELLDLLERSGRGQIDPQKLQKIRQMAEEFGDRFFEEFWVNQFFENRILAEQPDLSGPEALAESFGEVTEEEVSVVPQEAAPQVSQFLRKVEQLHIARKKRFKEILGHWKGMATQNIQETNEKKWKMFAYCSQIHYNKYRALHELRCRCQGIEGTDIEGDYWRRRSVLSFADGVRQKRSEIDRLKSDLDDIEAENLRISMQGLDYFQARKLMDKFPQAFQVHRPDRPLAPESGEGFPRDLRDPQTLETLGDDNQGPGLFDTGNLFKKFDMNRKNDSFLGPEYQNVALSMKDFHGVAANATPFDPQLTQILPDPSLQTQRLETNLSMSILNLYEPNREEVRRDNHLELKEDGPESRPELATDPLDDQLVNIARAEKSEPKISTDVPDQAELVPVETPLKISWLKKARLCHRLFQRLQRQRLWGAFCRMVAKTRAAKTALTGVSDRMMAKLLLSTRLSICGGDIKKSFRKWHMVANPEFSRDCIVKFLSRLPIRFQYVVYRMKALVHKRKTQIAPVQKVLSKGRGLAKLTEKFGQLAKGRLALGWGALTHERQQRKKRLADLLERMAGRHRRLVRRYWDRLRELSGKVRGAVETLVQASQAKTRVVLSTLVSQQQALKAARRIMKVGNLAASERVKSQGHLRAAWETIKAYVASRKRTDEIRRRVVMRMVYLAGAQLYHCLMTLKLHSLEKNKEIYNKKSDLISKMAGRFRENLAADKQKALQILRKFSEMVRAEEEFKKKLVEGKAAKYFGVILSNALAKKREALGKLVSHGTEARAKESRRDALRIEAANRMAVIAKSKQKKCLENLRAFNQSRRVMLRVGLTSLGQLVRRIQGRNQSLGLVRILRRDKKITQVNQGLFGKLAVSTKSKLRGCFQRLRFVSGLKKAQSDLENKQKAFLKLQTLRKMKGSLLLMTASQFTKLKSAFTQFVDEARKIRHDSLATSRYQHAALASLWDRTTRRLAEALANLRAHSQTLKTQSEEAASRKNRIMERLFGKPLTYDFGQINRGHFTLFAQNFQNTLPLSSQIQVAEIRKWMIANNIQGIFDGLIGVLDSNEGKCLHLIAPSLVQAMAADSLLQNPEFEAFRTQISNFLNQGRAKNGNIAQKYALDIASNPSLTHPGLQALRKSAREGQLERFEALKSAREKGEAEVIQILEAPSLREKVDGVLAAQKDKLDWHKLIGRPQPSVVEVCLALKAPKNMDRLSQAVAVINQRQERHFERLMCLVSCFLEVQEIPGIDISILMTKFGVVDTVSFLRVLDAQLIDWPFAFHSVLLHSANEKFDVVPFDLFNSVIRGVAEAENTKLKPADVKEVAQIFGLWGANQAAHAPMGQVGLFSLLARKQKLRRLCTALLRAFYLEQILGTTETDGAMLDESLGAKNILDFHDLKRTHPNLWASASQTRPHSFQALVNLAHGRHGQPGMEEFGGFLDGIRLSDTPLSKICSYLTSKISINPSLEDSFAFGLLNQKHLANILLDILADIVRVPDPAPLSRILNRLFTGGRVMDLTDFLILLQQVDHPSTRRTISRSIRHHTEGQEIAELVHLITHDRDCQEIREAIAILPGVTVSEVVGLTSRMKNTAGIQKIQEKVNGSPSMFVCCRHGGILGVSGPEETVHPSHFRHRKSKSLLEVPEWELPKPHTAFQGLNGISPYPKKSNGLTLEPTVSVGELPSGDPSSTRDLQFFTFLESFLRANPADSLTTAMREGQLDSAQAVRDHLVDSGLPKHSQLLEQLQKVLPLSIPERRKPGEHPASLIEAKLGSKLKLCLKGLRKFAKTTKREEGSLRKCQQQVLSRLKGVMAGLLRQSLTNLRLATGKIHSDRLSQHQLHRQLTSRLLQKLRISLTSKTAAALGTLQTNSRQWSLKTQPAIKKIVRTVLGIQNRLQAMALKHISRVLSAQSSSSSNLARLITRLERSRLRQSLDAINHKAARLSLSQSHLKLISLLTNAVKMHQKIIRRHFDVLTNKKARSLMANFVAKLEGLPVKRKMNAFYSVKAVYYRAKYRERIQGLNILTNFVSYRETRAKASAMETFVKKFRKTNPWFDRVLMKMMFLDATTDQNSLWKMRILGRMKESIMKPSDSLKLKRLAMIVERGIQKNKTFALFQIQTKLMAEIRKSQNIGK